MVVAYGLAGCWVVIMLLGVPFFARFRGHIPAKAGLLLLLLWGFCWVGVRSWYLRGEQAFDIPPADLEWRIDHILHTTLLLWSLCFGGVMLYLWLKAAPDPLADKLNQIGQPSDT